MLTLSLLVACTPEIPDPTPTEVDPAQALAWGISPDALWEHLEALQAQADANGGIRDVQDTRSWARQLLEDAGYDVVEQPFATVGWSHTRCVTSDCPGANLIATWPSEPSGPVLLVGGHMDLLDGPGINDNGTGVAAVLELALQVVELGLADEVPIRFALWDGEETGSVGALAYIGDTEEVPFDVTPAPVVDELLGYLNIDMVGSDNGVPAIWRVDHVRKSRVLDDAVAEWFEVEGREVVRWDWAGGMQGPGSSDHVPFSQHGVPATGLWSGGDELKTEDEAALFGGAAGEPYEDCYHDLCDDLDGVDLDLATDLTRAAGWAIGRLAGADAL